MGKKLQQVTDSIHGTIYLSNLETEMISTPYFYRLHDIYQSSTVYMTFPSNRTKRYEHSLGTMELAGNMLYSSVSNANIETKKIFFNYLGNYFEQILDLVISRFVQLSIPSYLAKNTDAINKLFGGQAYKNSNKGDIEKNIIYNIKEAISKGCFVDPALDYFQYSPMQVNERENNIDIKSYFLYRCLLQSIRIVALFHDVGHPPYSHIIESVLDNLYKDYSNRSGENNDKINNFVKCIDNYYEMFIQTLICKSSPTHSVLHEKIGLSFFQSAINDTVPYILEEILSSKRSKECKISSVLYYTLVVEFALSILTETDMFFKSMHKIIDGILDADRLDYITRDSLNSGVDWGKVPYKRLINSAKLIYINKNQERELPYDERVFVIAYPQKLTDDIEDILLIRYKIFARINFHHRCVKTANALSTSVRILADDYLNSENSENCINTEISKLWESLKLTVGDRRNRVILWNDSWLISTLNQALVKIDNAEYDYEENEGFFTLKVKQLKDNLDEILLNKKNFYAVLKRGVDNIKFVERIFSCLAINKNDIDLLREKELLKGYENINEKVNMENILSSSIANALDSLNRINEIIKDGDIEQLNSYFPTKNRSLKEIIEETLLDIKSKDKITDFIVYINKDKAKTGLPNHQDLLDEIYLYNNNLHLTFDENISLKPRIKSIAKNIPWLFIYVVPNKSYTDFDKLNEDILEQLANRIAEEMRPRLTELFPSLLIDKY